MAALSDGDQRGRMDTRKLHLTVHVEFNLINRSCALLFTPQATRSLTVFLSEVELSLLFLPAGWCTIFMFTDPSSDTE